MRVLFAATLLALLLPACGSSEVPAEPAAHGLPTPLPHDRHGHRVHRVADELIVVGGFSRSTGDRGTRETWLQDLRTGAWRQGAAMQRGRAFFGSAVVDGHVYALGGSVERYDAVADRWETLAPEGAMPESHFSAAVVGRLIVAVGGYPADRDPVVAFDVDTQQVSALPPLPDSRPGDHFHLVAALGGRLHVVGGLRGDVFDPTSAHWVLDGGTWREAAPPPVPVWGKFAAHGVVNGDLVVFDTMPASERGLRYDPALDAWSEVAPFPSRIVMPGCIAWDGRLHVVGGKPVADDDPVAGIWVYDASADRWAAE